MRLFFIDADNLGIAMDMTENADEFEGYFPVTHELVFRAGVDKYWTYPCPTNKQLINRAERIIAPAPPAAYRPFVDVGCVNLLIYNLRLRWDVLGF